jgi:S1-C subfamily serine protease
VQRVEQMSAAQEAGIDRGHVILEINRQPVNSVARMRRVIEAAPRGAALAVFLYVPEIDETNIRTVRLDTR